MRKNIMKIIAVSMAAMMAVSMVGCGANNKKENTDATTGAGTETAAEVTTEALAGNSAETTTEAADSSKEVTEQDLVDQAGVDLPVPDGATDVKYSIHDEIEFQIGQMDFTMNGEKMYLRACTTGETKLDDNPDEDLDEVTKILKKGDISGMDYNWENKGTGTVGDREAKYYYSSDGTGYIAWIDPVTGILYNLCMEQGATKDKLLSYAEKAFVPLQQ